MIAGLLLFAVTASPLTEARTVTTLFHGDELATFQLPVDQSTTFELTPMIPRIQVVKVEESSFLSWGQEPNAITCDGYCILDSAVPKDVLQTFTVLKNEKVNRMKHSK